MAYPSSVAGFPTHSSGQTISSANENNIQAEIVALEQALLSSGLAHLVQSNGLRFTAATSLALSSNSNGAITVTLFRHLVDTFSAASSGTLATISLGSVSNGIGLGAESLLLLTPANTSHVVTVASGVGNIVLVGGGSYVMSDAASALLLRYDGTNWNEISRSQISSSIGTPQSFSPSWTATSVNPVIGNGSITGSYIQIGKLVRYEIIIATGTTTTMGSGTYLFTLPVAAHTTDGVVGSAQLAYNTNEGRLGVAILDGSATTFIVTFDHDTGAGMGPTVPDTLIAADEIRIAGTYQAA